jgi:phosphatidylserine/phosphatidylglycerophosphate/cardiolipin synthase-like enzyme
MSENNGLQQIASEAGRLASVLPSALLVALVESIRNRDASDWQWWKGGLVAAISQPHYRGQISDFLDVWQSNAKHISPEAVAAALLTAGHSVRVHQQRESVELVWTGPDVGMVPLRRTEQALLQLIDSASRRATVVSYAVYNIPRIGEALVRAADRGVSINVIIETPDRLEGRNAYDTLKALGASVAVRCNVFLWPLEKREKDDAGKPGILHAKCAVADGRWLLLSSANLTEYAFTLNMELGLLVFGGNLPVQVEGHFDRMIQTGVLVRL